MLNQMASKSFWDSQRFNNAVAGFVVTSVYYTGELKK